MTTIAPWVDSIRLFLHILAATIWVGGQLTLAALVPVLRLGDPGLPKLVAQRFNKIAWPAYWVLVITGIWNVVEIHQHAAGDHAWNVTLIIKVAVVALSGVAAFMHTRAKTNKGLAIWGALTGLTALAATYVGVLLAG
jgi:putative copper export protein